MTLLSFRMRRIQLLIYKIHIRDDEKLFCRKNKKYYFAKKWGCHGTPGTPGVDGPVKFVTLEAVVRRCSKGQTLLKKRLWHRCFPANFVKFLRAPFFTEHLRWLLPKVFQTQSSWYLSRLKAKIKHVRKYKKVGFH